MTVSQNPPIEARIPVPQQRVYSPVRKSIEKLQITKGDYLEAGNYILIDAGKITTYLQAAKRAGVGLKSHKLEGGKTIVWRVGSNRNPRKNR